MPVTCDTADFAAAACPPASRAILLVEDEAAVRNVLSRFLSVKGYQVFTAGDARTAEHVWSSHKEDIGVLVSDVILPGGVNGFRLASRFRGQKPELEVILTSGYVSEAAAGANTHARFLAKPYRPDEMLEMIRATVSARSVP